MCQGHLVKRVCAAGYRAEIGLASSDEARVGHPDDALDAGSPGPEGQASSRCPYPEPDLGIAAGPNGEKSSKEFANPLSTPEPGDTGIELKLLPGKSNHPTTTSRRVATIKAPSFHS